MNNMIMALRSELEAQQDPAKADPMMKYMKNKFIYFGIKGPELSAITSRFFGQYGHPHISALTEFLLACWEQPEREFQYIAVGELRRYIPMVEPEFISTIEQLITTKSWWDTVDSLAANSVGPLFSRFPDTRDELLQRWIPSENMWLRRTTILFQLNYRTKLDFPLLTSIIEQNLGSKEFFINKAIGWALRQHSKIDRKAVTEFCDRADLSNLSRREALKWMNAHPNP